MDIRWSPEAADDLERIVDRIERENPAAAQRVAQLIYERCDSLSDLPNRGRLGRIDGTRELIFAPLPYIVVYRVRAEIVEIARIYHAAQEWP
ncbi:MAG TPA: type II toxin-antitoxin system RelE/ParE family toxin [Stellaceae bacterium]|jgi:toxin ParE1/3/4|nr:type II toxin-antitoxin system RelE/ParE family toxin [Stellaceae bacterium]